MGRVDYTPLRVGSATAADFNAITSAAAAQTANVDRENWAEEGLDERVFEDDIVSGSAFPKIVHNTIAAQGLIASFITLDPGGALPFRTGPFTTGAGERVRVRWKMDFLSDPTRDGVPLTGNVEVQLAFSVSAVVGVINSTLRAMQPFATEASRQALNLGQPYRVSCTAWLPSNTSFDWVEVQIRDVAGGITVQMGRGTLIGRTFKRVL